MPIIVIIEDKDAGVADFDAVYDYFAAIDARYSTYKDTSEITQINRGLPKTEWTDEMKLIFKLCHDTKVETNGYFDISHDGKLDPSGLVKGWAIQRAAELLHGRGRRNFSIDAGGDVQVVGLNSVHEPWRVGIRNPFNRDEIVKVVALTDAGIATSGTYIRGQHIYNPLEIEAKLTAVASLSVISDDIYEADRFATAALAMGKSGIEFIEARDGLEGYMIDARGVATMTSGFERYVAAA